MDTLRSPAKNSFQVDFQDPPTTGQLIPIPRTKQSSIALPSVTAVGTGVAASSLYYLRPDLILLDLALAGAAAFLVVVAVFIWLVVRKIQRSMENVVTAAAQTSRTTNQLAEGISRSPLKNVIVPPLGDDELGLYLAFRELRVDDLGKVLIALDELYRCLYVVANLDSCKGLINSDPANDRSDALLAASEQLLIAASGDRLIIHFAQTGNSFLFHVSPAVRRKLARLRRQGAISLLSVVLSVGFQHAGGIKDTLEVATGVHELLREGDEKKLQKEKLELEVRKLRREDAEAARQNFDQLPPWAKQELETRLRTLMDLTIRNKAFTAVEIRQPEWGS